jgi:hypothetical protein
MLIDIVKVSSILTIGKGHFQDGVQDGCLEIKLTISQARKLIEKFSQKTPLPFVMLIDLVKVSSILTIGKGSFSRWRPRWLSKAENFYLKYYST